MTVMLIRHAKAGSRRAWNGDDTLRPLTAAGREQADALAAEIGPVELILSSPAVRCRETVEPLSRLSDQDVEIRPALDEGNSGATGLVLVEALVDAGRHAAVCTHGDVLGATVTHLTQGGGTVSAKAGAAKGAYWRIDRQNGVLAATYLPAPSITPPKIGS